MLRDADNRTVRLVDVLVALWCLLWLLVAGVAGSVVWGLSDVADPIVGSGEALRSAGEAIRGLGDIPLVGDGPAAIGERIVATAEEVSSQGEGVRTRVQDTAILLALLIGCLPIAPVLAVYLPMRLARHREIDAFRRALAGPGRDPALDRYLAERAVRVLPYDRIRSLSSDPALDLATGRTAALADAELARLGLRRR